MIDSKDKIAVNAIVREANKRAGEMGDGEFIYFTVLGAEYQLGETEVIDIMDANGDWRYYCHCFCMFNHEKGGIEVDFVIEPSYLEAIVRTIPVDPIEDASVLIKYKDVMLKRYTQPKSIMSEEERMWLNEVENWYRARGRHIVISPNGTPQIVQYRTSLNDAHTKYWSELPESRRAKADGAKESLLYDQAMYRVLSQ